MPPTNQKTRIPQSVESWLSEERKGELKDKFKSLNKDLKNEIVFHLYYKQGLSKTVIADKCGTSISAMSQRIANLPIIFFEHESNPTEGPVDFKDTPKTDKIKRDVIYAPSAGSLKTGLVNKHAFDATHSSNIALLKLKEAGNNTDEIFQRLKEYHLEFSKEELEAYFKVASAIEGSVFPLLPEFSDL